MIFYFFYKRIAFDVIDTRISPIPREYTIYVLTYFVGP